MLLDGGGKEHSEALEQALAKQLPLCRVRRLRVRESGADVFMDITVEAPATLRLDAAHDVSCVIEDIAHEIVPYTSNPRRKKRKPYFSSSARLPPRTSFPSTT